MEPRNPPLSKPPQGDSESSPEVGKPESVPVEAGRSRRWMLGAVGVAAALVGATLSWRTRQAGGLSLAATGLATAAGDTVGSTDQLPSSAAMGEFWNMTLASPSGATIPLSTLRGKPLLLNFWATWCPPCVEELPLIDRFYKENQHNGWQVLGIAVDQVNPVNAFLLKMPLSFPVGMAGFAGLELSKAMGNLSGALPFTVIVGSEGALLHRKMGRVSAEDLRVWSALR